MTVTLTIVLLLNKAFIRLAELSEAKKSHFRRFYSIFLGVFFIIHGIVMGISNNAWVGSNYSILGLEVSQ